MNNEDNNNNIDYEYQPVTITILQKTFKDLVQYGRMHYLRFYDKNKTERYFHDEIITDLLDIAREREIMIVDDKRS